MLGGGKANIFKGKPDLIRENKEMQEEIKQRLLTELEQILAVSYAFDISFLQYFNNYYGKNL